MNTQPADDDQLLLKRIAAGDRDALSDLYTRYQRSLFTYLLQLTPDRGLAEELLQDTLVGVWRSACRFEGRSTVRTWLIGIARRQAHNALRQHKLPLADEAALEELATTEPDPEDFILACATRDELAGAIKQLAAMHREVLMLIFVQELSYQEVAEVLGVPIGTVKSRLNNAKRILRTLLSSREEVEQ